MLLEMSFDLDRPSGFFKVKGYAVANEVCLVLVLALLTKKMELKIIVLTNIAKQLKFDFTLPLALFDCMSSHCGPQPHKVHKAFDTAFGNFAKLLCTCFPKFQPYFELRVVFLLDSKVMSFDINS